IGRLTQTKWNGTVCQLARSSMPATLAAANAAQASSGQRLTTRERIPGMADGLHDGAAQLRAETADVDVDDVGARIEAAAPDLFEQLGPGADLALLDREVLEQEELARGERRRA